MVRSLSDEIGCFVLFIFLCRPLPLHHTQSVRSGSTGSGVWFCWVGTSPVGTGTARSRSAAGRGPRARILYLHRTRPPQRVHLSPGRCGAVSLAVTATLSGWREEAVYVELAEKTLVLQVALVRGETWGGGRIKGAAGLHPVLSKANSLLPTMSRAEPVLPL